MKSLLSWFILIVSIAVLVSSCSSSEDILPETTAPVIAEVTFVTTPTNDSTPNYTFSSDEAGTITYGGSCSSSTTSATTGDNTITRLFILKELAFLLIGLVFLTTSIQV